jgi:nitrite reductase/ring-hydroxylating ferredoxin subunit
MLRHIKLRKGGIKMTKNIGRRAFLKLTGAVGGAFLLTSCKVLDLYRGVPQTGLPQIAESWSYSDGVLSLNLASLPELGELGGAVRIEGEVLPDPILVVLGEDNNYYAFKNVCTHAGRKIDPVAGTMTLKCCTKVCEIPSTFDYQGKVKSGLAEGPLTSYRLSVEDDQLIIHI